MTYHYFNCPNTFANASATCQSMGGFLTSYTNAAEQNDLESWFIGKVGEAHASRKACLLADCRHHLSCMDASSAGWMMLEGMGHVTADWQLASMAVHVLKHSPDY